MPRETSNLPVSFHFKVEFGINSSEADNRFQEVTGLGAEVTVEELKEGGLNEFTHKLPTGVKYDNLILKRGYIHDSEISKWCRTAIEEFSFETKDVTVTLLNEKHESLASWQFIRAWPVKWSISDFKAQDNAIVVESLELAYGMFRKG